MEQKFVIDTSLPETRVGLLEDNKLVEIFTEMEVEGDVGNFYRGRVIKVLPALQSAFVDVGLPRDGFLGWDDILLTPEERKQGVRKIEDVIRDDDMLLVQMAKEPRGHKGCRLTTRFSIPGRYLVLLPGASKVMVSKKITNEKERKRLKSIVSAIQKPKCGFIIRTVSEGISKTELSRDAKYLIRLWERTEREFNRGKKPHLLTEELGVVQRVLRDKWTKKCREIQVDSPQVRTQVLDALSLMAPRTPLRKMVKVLEGKGSVFASLGVDDELQKALDKKVWLPSGGYLIFEESETLTVIDVNSGRLTKGQNPNAIALKTNLEATEEIARQLRLRNVGGIIVIDFINVKFKKEQDRVLKYLHRNTKSDRLVTDIYDFSDLGVVQMCRERNRKSIVKSFTIECPHCRGSGRLPKYRTDGTPTLP